MTRRIQIGSALLVALMACASMVHAAQPSAANASAPVAASPAAAQAPADAAADVPADAVAGAPAVDASAVPAPAPLALSPLRAEIQQLLDNEHAAVTALTDKLASTHDAAEQLALQRQVQEAKERAQLGILEAQLRFASAAGKTDAVTALQAAIDAVKNPAAQPVSIDRPAPSAAPAPGTGAGQ